MEIHDCMVLNIPGSPDIFELVKQALKGITEVALLEAKDFVNIETRKNSEIGLVFIPVDELTDLLPYEALAQSCSKQSAKLSVLLVASSNEVAQKIELADLFDGLICLEWSTSAALIRKAFADYKIRTENRALKIFMDHSVDGYWIWDIRRDRVEWSHRTSELVGLKTELAPKNMDEFVELIHLHDRDRVEQAINNHFLFHAPYRDIEMRLRQGDGSYGYYLANGMALRNNSDRPLLLVGSLSDRTLAKGVEQKLVSTKKRFDILFHHMNDAAVLADIETGIILEANQPSERLWGRSISQLVGSHQSELHPPSFSEDAKKAFSDHISALMKNKRATLQFPIMRLNGEVVPAEISSSIIEIEGKTTILGVFRDISDRVQAEKDIRERDAQIQLSSHLSSIGTLAAGVAHEINNPLTYVVGNLELLNDRIPENLGADNAIQNLINGALTGATYIREIVGDLKAISDRNEYEPTSDPSEVIRIASRMVMAELKHRATLELNLANNLRVPLSSARMSQVILNILSNSARAFSSSDPSENIVKLTTYAVDGFARIDIEDNGSGISEDDLKRIWDPFFTRNRKKGGTGLGLSITRRILTDVGGSTEIQSALGAGTLVRIGIPLVTAHAQLERVCVPQEPEHPLPEGKPRLLVVDDNALVLGLVTKILQVNFTVTTFLDARDALRQVEQGAVYDLVLSDIMMPGMTGKDFYLELCKLGDYAPKFLVMTAGSVTKEEQEFEQQMVNRGRVIYKPFKASEFLLVLEKNFRQSRVLAVSPINQSQSD